MNYEIRLASLNDCSELSKLKLKVWNTTYKGIYTEDKFDNYDFQLNEEKFKKIIENKDINLYVVTNKNNEIVAYMSVGKPVREFNDYEQEIGLLYILKEYQGLGIGKNLFNLAYNKIKEKGYSRFFISCNKYNQNAQKFYEKMGGKTVEIDEDNIDKSYPQIKYHYDIK